MRRQLRNIFNAAVGLVPPFLLRGLFKTFVTHPNFAERAGFQVYPKVFYSPFPDPEEVDVDRLERRRELPAIDLHLDAALSLLSELRKYASELSQFPIDTKTGSVEWSQTYPSFDTATLYGMLRHLRPRHYIEVGCGYSTRVSTAALHRNAAEGTACDSVFIEPFPAAHFLRDSLPGEFLQRKVQDVPLERFRQLAAGDVLFIDTSHVLKVQNDVEHELLRILPSLASGVYVHVHDIFTPYDYPAEWLVGCGPLRGGNNEQYALECLLSGGDGWEVSLPVYCLWRERIGALGALLPGAKDRPAAIWIRKR